MPTITRTIITPIVTEQTSSAYQDRGEYTFRVHPEATKTQIKLAIEELFNVTVTGVWTSNHRGKDRRVGQVVGRRPHWKKAIVRLAQGDSIDIFEA
jgi:large subunit ribosomal protein L23